MDRTWTSQFNVVYRELCEITHFGSLAMWAGHMPGDEAQNLSWTSYPRFREGQDLLACAQLLELAEMMDHALGRLGVVLLANV